jgi:TPR repeat protein
MTPIRESESNQYETITAQLELGLLNYDENPEVARNWFKKAAKQKCIDATYHLARMYLDGIGGKKRIEKGLKLLETISSSKDKDIDALELLAEIHYNGEYGVKADPKRGMWYLREAYGNGSSYAADHIPLCYVEVFWDREPSTEAFVRKVRELEFLFSQTAKEEIFRDAVETGTLRKMVLTSNALIDLYLNPRIKLDDRNSN